jgi:hypothetical protein
MIKNLYKNHTFLMFFGTILVMYFVVIPTADDAYRAYVNTDQGDWVRLFQYYTTARYQGVPMALDNYGVKSK